MHGLSCQGRPNRRDTAARQTNGTAELLPGDTEELGVGFTAGPVVDIEMAAFAPHDYRKPPHR